MELTARVAAIIAPSIEALGYELVRVHLLGGRSPVLQVMAERIDRAAMTVDDCARISRAASALLDVEDPVEGSYALEVSSPGIDRPLVRRTDFERFAGHLARVETRAPVEGRKRFRGVVRGLDGDDVVLEAEDGERALVPFDEIQRAKLVLTDELLASARRAEAAAEQN
ncbi:MAG: ribosome maturation factor RimP [Inquilinus sp.]|nr:ribosome maturation factor RimP [Inquilinus sp.]